MYSSYIIETNTLFISLAIHAVEENGKHIILSNLLIISAGEYSGLRILNLLFFSKK